MPRSARRRKDGTPIRCKRRCYPNGNPPTRVVTGDGTFYMTYCRVCRWAIPPLELMRPRLEIVRPQAGKEE